MESIEDMPAPLDNELDIVCTASEQESDGEIVEPDERTSDLEEETAEELPEDVPEESDVAA